MDSSVKVGALFIILLLGFGIFQAVHGNLAKSSLAGAAILEKPQREINLCMRDCMRECVHIEGQEQQCLDECDPKCAT